MLKLVNSNLTWGINPVLFRIGGFEVESYSFFVCLGVIVGSIIYLYLSRRQKSDSASSQYILLAAIVGGALGAKLPVLIENYRAIVTNWPDVSLLLSGRTIVGGIIAVELTKRMLNITAKQGNIFVPALSAGFMLGRIGCFLRGCCFGKPTSLPFGADFGDGVLRHPTQIYESVFFLVWLIISTTNYKKFLEGRLFQYFILSYFVFRFFVEFLRSEPIFWHGLTLAQIAAIPVIGYYVYILFKKEGLYGK